MTPDVVFIDYKDIIAFQAIIILILLLIAVCIISGIVMLIQFICKRIKHHLNTKRKGGKRK